MFRPKILLISGLVLIGIVGICLISRPLLCHVARHNLINDLSRKVTSPWHSDMDKAMALMVYVHLEEASPDVHTVAMDADVVTDLMRGIGYCDQKSNLLMQLLHEQGIEARMLMYRRHTVCEAMLDGRWVLLDPQRCDVFSSVTDSLVPLGMADIRVTEPVFSLDGTVVTQQYRDSVATDELLKTQVMPNGASRIMLELVCSSMRKLPYSFQQCTDGHDRLLHDESMRRHSAFKFLVARNDTAAVLQRSGTMGPMDDSATIGDRMTAEYMHKVVSLARTKPLMAHYCAFDLMAFAALFERFETQTAVTPASQQ
jgi:hypothetical protein